MAIYRPWCRANVSAPLVTFGDGGGEVEIPMRVHSANLSLNSHLHPDELELEADWSDVGIDPRFVRSCLVAFELGEGEPSATPSRQSLRFFGIGDVSHEANDEGAQVARLRALDFTTLFLAMKPFPADGVPVMSDTLIDAWRRICDSTGFVGPDRKITSSVTKLRERLEFRGGVDGTRRLGSAYPRRIAAIGGAIPVKHGADAWAVWQQCVGMLGLVSWIELDKCIVSTTTDQFETDPDARPVMIYGKNILSLKESAPRDTSKKGVCVMSYDPISGTTLEAFYHPDPQKLAVARNVAKVARDAGNATSTSDDYDPYPYYGVTDPDALHEIARRIYAERSLQELRGELTTAEMRVEQSRGTALADLLALRWGDTIQVQLDPSIDRGVFSTLSETSRVEYLVARGYAFAPARLMAANAKTLMAFGLTMLVHAVHVSLSTDGDSGRFLVRIEYRNRIDIEKRF